MNAKRSFSVLLGALAAALAIDAGRWGYQHLRGWRVGRAIFERATAAPRRPFEARLSYALADRHRPPGGRCVDAGDSLLRRHQDLAELEKAGNLHGLASVYALACDPRRARRLLDTLPPSSDLNSDLAALQLDDPNAQAAALVRLDEVLRANPRHPQALWNRALVLEALRLPIAAARSFRLVASLGEPGWGQEASTRASRLEQDWHRRVRKNDEAKRAAEAIATGAIPSAQIITQFPDLVRSEFYRAVRANDGAAALRLLPAAQAIDRLHGGDALAAMAKGAVDLRRMATLSEKPLTTAKAQAYQRMAAMTGDPWQQIQGWQLLARAEADARNFPAALTAFEAAFALCRQRSFPGICTETKLWLARHHSDRFQLQQARRLALEAKHDSQVHNLIHWDVRSNGQLQRLENFRQEFGLAWAYAEENSLHDENCESAQGAREYLAETALQQGDRASARRHLATVRECPNASASRPRFGLVGLSVLGTLIRDPAASSDERTWFTASLLAHAAQQSKRSPLDQGYLPLFEARGIIEREPARANALLEAVIERSEAMGSADEGAATMRLQALSTLMVDASARGEHNRVLDLLARALRVTSPTTCVVGVAAQGAERAYVARGPSGSILGQHAAQVTGKEEPVLPTPVQAIVASCPRVDVLASGPLLGRSRLLPDHQAWAFLVSGQRQTPMSAAAQRLVVHDVASPVSLELPRLARVDLRAPAPGTTIVSLEGEEATPQEVIRRLPDAGLIELHVHGILDRKISDAPALVLSQDASGVALLSAREIEKLRLAKQPAVILAACEAGQSARYWSFQHSLPAAFVQAGARWVVASPAIVEDSDAGPFFDRLRERIRAGTDLAVALRDERQSSRWQGEQSEWVRNVVAFY